MIPMSNHKFPMTNSTLPQILVVDDDAEDLHLLATRLRRANYIVIECQSGEDAIALTLQAQPDLILLDVLMPGLDGFTTCQRIKAIPHSAEIPIIFLTSLMHTTDKVRGFEVGGVDFIVKPPQFPEVLARIENHLALRRSRLELRELNQQLEEVMQKRTVELHNESLWRRQYEQEVDKLLEVVLHQGKQLATLMQFCMDRRSDGQPDFTQTFTELSLNYFNLIRTHLRFVELHVGSLSSHSVAPLISEHLAAATQLLDTVDAQIQQATTPLPHLASHRHDDHGVLAKLSAREYEILRLVADGRANADIAELLCLAEPTVRVYRSRIMGKLQLDDAAALIKFAIKHKLTTVN